MDATSLAISLVAVAVSLYGVVERHQAVLRSTRSQLAALVNELNELNVTEAQSAAEGGEGPPQRDPEGSLSFRRALIAEQASSLERMIRGRDVVAEEYATLAAAYESVGDLDRALQLWQQAVARAASSSVMTQVACRRSLAGCRYLHGDVDGARQTIEVALAILPEHDRGRLDYVETCVDLAGMEHRVAPGGAEERQALARARAAQAQIREPALRAYAGEVIGERSVSAPSSEADASSAEGGART